VEPQFRRNPGGTTATITFLLLSKIAQTERQPWRRLKTTKEDGFNSLKKLCWIVLTFKIRLGAQELLSRAFEISVRIQPLSLPFHWITNVDFQAKNHI
jgi:hypothetical protein